MLSQHDRRVLADIEAGLRASDPDLARRLEHPPVSTPLRGSRAWRRSGLAGLILGLILLAAAFATHSADVAVSAITVLVVVSAGAAVHAVYRIGHRAR